MIKMNRVLAASLLLAIPFAAEATVTTYSFSDISKIEYVPASGISVTGLLLNETTPTTVTVPRTIEECDSIYKQVLSNQGGYILSITLDVQTVTGPDGIPSVVTFLRRCAIERAP